MTAVAVPAPGQAGPRAPVRPAADLLHEARARERAACIPEAIRCYEAAIATAERTGDGAVLPEALRRLAVVWSEAVYAAFVRAVAAVGGEVDSVASGGSERAPVERVTASAECGALGAAIG